jgi:hypothetical protein
MAAFIFLGWLLGLILGTLAAALLLLCAGVALPFSLTGLAGLLLPLITAVGPATALVLAAVFMILCFLAGYFIATAGIAPLLPGATGLPAVTFPLPFPLGTPGGVPVTIPPSIGEFFGRGLLIGLSAAINTVLLSAVPSIFNVLPVIGPVLAGWAFLVISLSAVVFVARNRVYQGFLGWSGWVFPLSYLATAVGLLLFVLNIPFAFAAFGLGAFAIDWTTGVIETLGGLPGITGLNGGFSLGNFNFLAGAGATGAGPAPARFTAPSVSSHETGHSLNTAATGGIVLWINAVDESVLPVRFNLAYGEMTAEGHARNMPGPSVLPPGYSVRHWV